MSIEQENITDEFLDSYLELPEDELDDNFDVIDQIVDGLECFITGDIPDKLTPNQAYVQGVMYAEGVNVINRVNGSEGFLDKLKDGIKKVWEMLVKAFNAVKDFFGIKSKNNKEQLEENKKQIEKEIEEVEKAGMDTYEVNTELRDKLAEALTANEDEDCASTIKSASNPEAVVQAFKKMITLLEKKALDDAGAEEALRAAEKANNELNNSSNGVKNDATADEKSVANEKVKEAKTKAQEANNDAKDKVKKAYKGTASMAKLKGALKKILVTKKSSKEGTESYEL